ncbi:hypothetical protein BLNAU_14495 [Blattamonas nauphoetae]|uniref:Uncharacterized protein n=1 Tax=Blattamonas nauphoetae TaxID=2049346 RepID=A0ABQ9XDN9_9EUKA|nr:hypothetical protein BLNAU_14495 [Blattamonas nauphoetae]
MMILIALFHVLHSLDADCRDFKGVFAEKLNQNWNGSHSQETVIQFESGWFSAESFPIVSTRMELRGNMTRLYAGEGSRKSSAGFQKTDTIYDQNIDSPPKRFEDVRCGCGANQPCLNLIQAIHNQLPIPEMLISYAPLTWRSPHHQNPIQPQIVIPDGTEESASLTLLVLKSELASVSSAQPFIFVDLSDFDDVRCVVTDSNSAHGSFLSAELGGTALVDCEIGDIEAIDSILDMSAMSSAFTIDTMTITNCGQHHPTLFSSSDRPLLTQHDCLPSLPMDGLFSEQCVAPNLSVPFSTNRGLFHVLDAKCAVFDFGTTNLGSFLVDCWTEPDMLLVESDCTEAQPTSSLSPFTFRCTVPDLWKGHSAICDGWDSSEPTLVSIAGNGSLCLCPLSRIRCSTRLMASTDLLPFCVPKHRRRRCAVLATMSQTSDALLSCLQSALVWPIVVEDDCVDLVALSALDICSNWRYR